MYFCETFYDGLWTNENKCMIPISRNEGSNRRLSLLKDGDSKLFDLLQDNLSGYLENRQFTKSPRLTTQYYTRQTKSGKFYQKKHLIP